LASGELLAVGPGGAVSEAAAEDADEPVRDGASGSVVGVGWRSSGVVERAC
jgi:hypothetical protein